MRALLVLRRASSSVATIQGAGDTKYVISRVTGKILKTADETPRIEDPVPAPSFSLDESLRYLEESYQKGELAATTSVRSAIQRMRKEVDKYDELLLLDEVDDLRLT